MLAILLFLDPRDTHEKRLLKDLFQNYDKEVLPVLKKNDTVNVEFSLALIQIISVVSITCKYMHGIIIIVIVTIIIIIIVIISLLQSSSSLSISVIITIIIITIIIVIITEIIIIKYITTSSSLSIITGSCGKEICGLSDD